MELTQSTPNQGSTFRITLDSQLGESPTGAAPIEELADEEGVVSLKGIHVLLAEDNPDNEELVRTYLTSCEAKVTSVSNGGEAVELALKENFDVILMDVQMPVLDGLQATERLRSRGYLKPIIALTAHAMIEERTRCLQAGCNDFLTKPIDAKKLIHTVERLARASQQS